ncbi:MAG: tryptophan--tRNA ligase [Ruminiclostridium sp.]|nr:tryptophan--tRNA ligase [Ruminiclostridium sp.]
MENDKKIIFSATQPSGKITLGNYLGAMRNWVRLQDDYNALYCVADMHAITVRQNPADLRRQSMELFAQFIACGLDPEKSIIFIQSHVPQHAELAWILNCYTMYGELSRMTQFKDKSASHADNVNAGLFTYPALMAADILLYGTHCVPVGEDQRQHVELARNIAQRFNSVYGDVFTMPEAVIPKVAARVMSLSEPEKKMSKSNPNENSYVLVMDKPDAIMRKFKRAVTDSEGGIYRSPEKPGVSNLIEIYSAVTGKTFEEVENEFAGKGYGDFKPAVGEAVVECLRPIREETERLLADKASLEALYRQGAEKAANIAYKTLRKVHKKVGFASR